MGRFSGVLIASDLDGTLLDSRHEISSVNRRAMERFAGEGGLFAVATGRSKPAAERLMTAIPASAPAILANGGVLYDFAAEKLLHLEGLSPEAIEAVYAARAAFPGAGMEIHLFDKKYALCRNAAISAHLSTVSCTAADVSSLDEAEGVWVKVLFADETALLSEIAGWIRARFLDRLECVFSGPFLLELQGKGVDKASGLLRLAGLLGVARENVFAAGDNENDLSMLRAVESFAPRNATAEAARAADHMLPHCDKHAIAAMIDMLADRYG